MRHRSRWIASVFVALVLGLTTTCPGPAGAQDKPRYGGQLDFVVPSEPPSYDAHAEETFGVIHPDRPALQPAGAGRPLRPDRHQAGGRSGRVLDDLQGRPGLHVQAAAGGEVPRRQRDDLEGREGVLRQDHLPARGGEVAPQGVLQLGGGRGGAGSVHGALPPQVPRVLAPPEPGLAVELDLQGGHPRQGHALVREERHGHRALPLRRARQGLALGGQEEPELLGQGQALPRRLPGHLHQLLGRAGGGHPRGARPHPVPRLQPAGAGPARLRRSATRSRCRRAPGTA